LPLGPWNQAIESGRKVAAVDITVTERKDASTWTEMESNFIRELETKYEEA
jgi:hypothetical protein